MKKLMWRIMTIIIVLISWVMYSHPDWVVDPPAIFGIAYAQGAEKGDPSQELNPNRPYFDGWGNEFSAYGDFLKLGSCDTSTPSGANPYCPAPVSATPAVNPLAIEANAPDFQGK